MPGRLRWPGVWPSQLCGCAVCNPRVSAEAEVQRDVLRLAKEKLLTLCKPNAGYAQTAAGAAAAKAADFIRTMRGKCLIDHARSSLLLANDHQPALPKSPL
jgi:hypothetical protein